MIIQIFSSHHLSASEMVDMADQVEKVGDCATLKKEHLRRYVINITCVPTSCRGLLHRFWTWKCSRIHPRAHQLT